MTTIYALCDTVVRYIGATSNLKQRLSAHLSKAGKYNAKVSQWLYEMKDRKQKPTIQVLEVVPPELDWESREIHWIAVYSGPNLLNQTIGGKGSKGFKWSEEDKVLIGKRTSLIHKGMHRTPEARDRMRAAQLRIVAKLAVQGKKKTHRPPTEETKAKIASAMRGKKHSEESKAKMSAQRQNPSAALREKWAEAARRRDPEWRAWFAQQQKGKPKSAETKKKMSIAAKARWAKKKTSDVC
jgi:hypothetical protein